MIVTDDMCEPGKFMGTLSVEVVKAAKTLDTTKKVRLFRKKPLPVAATQWFKLGDHPRVFGYDQYGLLVSADEKAVTYGIATAEGHMQVTPGCWVVGPGHADEYWPVQPAIFAATYEELPSDENSL